MNALQKLEQLRSNKPYRGFARLPLGYHQIDFLRFGKSKYGANGEESDSGRTIIAELKREIVFLPQYFANNLNESDIEELNTCIKGEGLFLFFGGRGRNSR